MKKPSYQICKVYYSDDNYVIFNLLNMKSLTISVRVVIFLEPWEISQWTQLLDFLLQALIFFPIRHVN